jgi:hypothetical protein
MTGSLFSLGSRLKGVSELCESIVVPRVLNCMRQTAASQHECCSEHHVLDQSRNHDGTNSKLALVVRLEVDFVALKPCLCVTYRVEREH